MLVLVHTNTCYLPAGRGELDDILSECDDKLVLGRQRRPDAGRHVVTLGQRVAELGLVAGRRLARPVLLQKRTLLVVHTEHHPYLLHARIL